MSMKEKYYYDGIPLSQYCKEHGIDMGYIRSRIWKKKHSKKGADLSDEEIIDSVIKVYHKPIKCYMYNGMAITQYCELNQINYHTISGRIRTLKKDYPNLTEEKIIDIALNDFDKYKKRRSLYYKGEKLTDFCAKRPDINYAKLARYIRQTHKKNPMLTDDEIIDTYLKEEHRPPVQMHTYTYKGMPLAEYAKQNNLNYENVRAYISRRRDKEKYKNLTDEELVNIIMQEYTPFEIKYQYQGISLRQYCIENNISYYSIVTFVKRSLAKGSTKSIDDLIDEGIKTVNRYGIIYYYKGIPLKDYAEQNGLNAQSIRCAIKRKQLKSDKPLQEIIDECVDSYQKFSIKYHYHGESLIKASEKLGINYNTIIHRYLDDLDKYSNMSIDDAIASIVDYYIEHPPIQIKYYINDIPLSQYCKNNGYLYSNIYQRMRTLYDKGNTIEDSIEKAIDNYVKKLEIEELNTIFNSLNQNEEMTKPEIKNICNKLKINFENFKNLIEFGFSYEQGINLIWYFYDQSDENGLKRITETKLNDVLQLAEDLKIEEKENLKNYDLYDLIGIYKSKIYDSRNEILLARENYIKSIIRNTCRSYGVQISDNNFEDFKSELNLCLINVIDKISTNIKGQIIKFMDITLKGQFKKYLKKEIQQGRCIRLDDAKYAKDKNNSQKTLLIDTLEDKNANIEDQEKISFGKTMMQALSSLDEVDLRFIILKYQENYTNEELSAVFHIDVDAIEAKDATILKSLRKNETIKVMKKSISE